MRGRFEGWYFKHQFDGHTLAVIPGRSDKGAFVQVITENSSYEVKYPLEECRKNKMLHVGNNVFSGRGIQLAIENKELSLHGNLVYGKLTHIWGDIMGPFQFFPMECRHAVISMGHCISGSVVLNGETMSYSGGKGYIEADNGCSFPTDYMWIHCNDFAGDCSIMAAVAKIPFCGLRFWGCICIVWLNGREYRIATYKGAKIRQCLHGTLLLEQGNCRLEIVVDAQTGYTLAAPQTGNMSRAIRENASCPARFRLVRKGVILFDEKSDHASYEYAMED